MHTLYQKLKRIVKKKNNLLKFCMATNGYFDHINSSNFMVKNKSYSNETYVEWKRTEIN